MHVGMSSGLGYSADRRASSCANAAENDREPSSLVVAIEKDVGA